MRPRNLNSFCDFGPDNHGQEARIFCLENFDGFLNHIIFRCPGALAIQSPCQRMIGVYNHQQHILVPLPFSEGEPGSLGVEKILVNCHLFSTFSGG